MKESIIFSNQNLSEKAHYVYRVTIDEKYYIGKRSGLLNDLHTGRYKTSSNIIKEKLKNGMTFSKIKIIQVFSSSKDALEFENRILTRLNARTNPKFLNQCNGNKDLCLKQHTEKTKEKMSKSQKEYYNTEEGIKRREDQSNKKKEYFNTELGRKRRDNHSEFMKEKAKERLQKRQNASILGELMFDEAFIRQNFLILDDKNNQRFLSSVYSKLTGYSMSHICEEKRIGKLNFLYGITSIIKITEEQENSKIEAIEAIIKSRNKELSLKAS